MSYPILTYCPFSAVILCYRLPWNHLSSTSSVRRAFAQVRNINKGAGPSPALTLVLAVSCLALSIRGVRCRFS